jgi:hypothetical protein
LLPTARQLSLASILFAPAHRWLDAAYWREQQTADLLSVISILTCPFAHHLLVIFFPLILFPVMSFIYGLTNPRGNHVLDTLFSLSSQLETIFGRDLPSTATSAGKIRL